MQHNYLASKQQWQEEKGGAGEAGSTPVEQSAFMTDWKDYRVSPLYRTHAVSHSRPNFSNRHAISSRRVAISAMGDVASPLRLEHVQQRL